MTYKLVRNFAACAAFTLVASSVVAEGSGFTPIAGAALGAGISGGEDRLTENVSLNGGGGKVACQDISLADRRGLAVPVVEAPVGLSGEDLEKWAAACNSRKVDNFFNREAGNGGFSNSEKIGIAAGAATLFFMLNQGGSTNNTPKR